MSNPRPSTSSERTPLVSGNIPPTYVYHAQRLRQHQKQIRQFQCCLCATLMGIFITIIVASISYSINPQIPLPENVTEPNIIPPPHLNLTSPRLMLANPRDDIKPSNIINKLSNDDLETAKTTGTHALADRDWFEKIKNEQLPIDSPSYRHQKSVPTSARATNLARSGYASEYATKAIIKKNNISINAESKWSFPIVPEEFNATWWPKDYCKYINDVSNTSCGSHKYRTIDGSCNNEFHKYKWGVAFTPFRRAIPPVYADGVSEPRKAVTGESLPSAREVSVLVHRPSYKDDPKFTVMLAVWGQFMDHDVTATALNQGANGTSISCCHAWETPGLVPHPECFPVRLAANDPFYHQYNITCMEFVRSAAAPTCGLGPREQLNQVSAYLDGSVVYGSTTPLMKKLRSFENGFMKTYMTDDGRPLLPISDDPNDGCNRVELNAKGRYCFLSGDARANENLHLTTMHLLWVRQHNRLATKLKKLNPSWNDETLYQESRRIVSAQIQHITYNEFLPIIVGPNIMKNTELYSETGTYYSGYNSTIDASIANEFAAAMFRFAHTLLPTLMASLSKDKTNPDYIEMHKILFNPYNLYNRGEMDNAIRGAMFTNLQPMDPYFSKEFKEHLFERDSELANYTYLKPKTPAPCGLDLVSLNIQRGRDHGLAPYPQWREFCGYPRPKTWEDLSELFDAESFANIKSIYKNVDDIDLYTGALSEYPRTDGILGRTATCLIVDQFIRMKRGDRFWYETGEKPQGFTLQQLNEIRQTTLARIICDNSDNITIIQPQVMMNKWLFNNSEVNCNELHDIDLKYWKDFPRVKLTSTLNN